MPVRWWIFPAPALLLLIAAVYTLWKRRRWPSFSVGLLLCDVYFLACMMVVNTQLRLFLQMDTKPLAIYSYPVPIRYLAALIIRGRPSVDSCTVVYAWLRSLIIILILCTALAMALECYRIFSIPPELAAARKNLFEREEQPRRGIFFGRKGREQKPYERKNKL